MGIPTAIEYISASSTSLTAAAMQKSKSSSNVGSRLVGKKIWKTRSKSSSRVCSAATSSWTPQGNCTWTNLTGRQISLTDTVLLQVSEIERRILQKVALAKLQALNLGVSVRFPSETVAALTHKPKRRVHLLKRKALTTGFFDTGRKDSDKEKEGNGSVAGLVFGIPLGQCIENDIAARGSFSHVDDSAELRRKSHHGSRTSFSSLIETTARSEETAGSCESLLSTPMDRIAGSVPGLLDSLSSCGSTTDISSSLTAENEPRIPQIVTSCLRHLETHGLNTLGIFRVSSSKKRVRQLREDFDSGKEINLSSEQCPHDVATLLKEFFRDLPEPLLCRDLYKAFVQTQRIRNRRLQHEALQHLIQILPVPNRDTLWALLNFLSLVAKHSQDYKNSLGEVISGNKMDSNNLATLFAPNILHCVAFGKNEVSCETPEERGDAINVIRTMIDHNKELFQVSADLLDEVYLHLMDSHPELLDQLLRKKYSSSEELLDDLEVGSLESCEVTPSIPTRSQSVMEGEISELATSEHHSMGRRVWSREEFLHQTAGMGGPDVEMRPRHKDRDRGRERSSKKRWKEEQDLVRIGSSGSNSSLISISSSTIKSANISSSRQKTERQEFNSTTSGGSSGVITASLKIPMQIGGTLSLNMDDADIPFIEDNSGLIAAESGKQQLTIGMVSTEPVPPQRRQRSASGSDSSQCSAGIMPVTGSISLIQSCVGGYDSALGSSATFGSPPYNTTTPSSGCSSSIGQYSSPPSWASSPPNSPDSTQTSVDYIPDETQAARISLTVTKGLQYSKMDSQKKSLVTAKEVAPIVLQKVTFTKTTDLQREKASKAPKEEMKLTSLSSLKLGREISKSSSSSAVLNVSRDKNEEEAAEKRRSPSASITSIGGAVLRSKTADIERMIKTQQQAEQIIEQSCTDKEKKKYTKRRYTDSRHQTRHIPDSESLSSADTKTDKEVTHIQRTSQQGSMWKRREIIASEHKECH